MSTKICGKNNKPLKIQFITDTHYYSRSLGESGSAYKKAEAKSQKVIKDSDLVLKAAFDMLCTDTSTDIVLLGGDTTRDGELASHAEFIEMLRDLKKRGKRVYVITVSWTTRKLKCRPPTAKTFGTCTTSSARTRRSRSTASP